MDWLTLLSAKLSRWVLHLACACLALLGLVVIYGVVLVVYGIVGSSDAQLAKSDGLNINLYAGIGMVVVAALFVVWARLRPVVVPVRADAHEDEGEGAGD